MDANKTKEDFLNYLSKELEQIIELEKKLTIEDLIAINSSDFDFDEIKNKIKKYKQESNEIIKKQYFEGFDILNLINFFL